MSRSVRPARPGLRGAGTGPALAADRGGAPHPRPVAAFGRLSPAKLSNRVRQAAWAVAAATPHEITAGARPSQTVMGGAPPPIKIRLTRAEQAGFRYEEA